MKSPKIALAVSMLVLMALAPVGSTPSSGPVQRAAIVVYGETAARAEVHAAQELARDLERVRGLRTRVVSASAWRGQGGEGAIFLVGTAASHSLIGAYAAAGKLQVSAFDPGPEAFVIRSFPAAGEVVIAGSDARGVLYGVYEFSERVLGVDPLEFWTGKRPPAGSGLAIPDLDLRARPPAFALRGYFDNDSDMLANFSGQKLIIEFELWKEMIDSLARLGYNFIDPFDTLGRTEFWVWPYYRERFPGYHADLELIDRIIDYAHEKGMLVQVSTYLGYEFHHLDYDDKCLSRHHDDWMAAYRDLLEKTPVGKADIFYHSPRDPWWDRPYRCPSERLLGIKPGPLHTRVVNELEALIAEHNPQAKLISVLWSDATKGWRDGSYQPDPAIDLVWGDNGYGLFPSWPDDFRGHRFGVYVHAGFWRNHVLQDPYPERLGDSIRQAARRDLAGYCFVNGQDFKHFILNLEAAGRAAWDPEGFDPEAFYREWAQRYFGPAAAPAAVSSLKALHQAHDLAGGFTHLTIETNLALKFERAGAPWCKDRSYRGPALEAARRSFELAEQAAELAPPASRLVFADQVLFPARLYLANLELHDAVAGSVQAHCDLLDPLAPLGRKLEAPRALERGRRDAPEKLETLLELLEQGSGWDKWDGWTRVENFRKYQPPPTREELAAALR